MFGKSLIFIASTLAPIVRRLVSAAIAQDEERAKQELVNLMLEGKRVAMKKRRGG